jgi:4-diphosphocytidyl-2-C-methyl-D-erythritol kinase
MISMPSFAKINLGLKIGARRPDGFHELRTVYQTLALHDVVRVEVQPGSGIEIRCDDPRVPLDESNTCYKIAERLLAAVRGLKPKVSGGMLDAGLKARSTKVIIEIEKRLPVQGGMGAASSNAVAAMLGIERALGLELAAQDKLRIAAEVGSDLPLFLIGGTVLGVGRGEEVYPLPDLPSLHVVVVTPPIGVSTSRAFARWDELNTLQSALTHVEATGTINEFSESVFDWLSKNFPQVGAASNAVVEAGARKAEPASGVPAVGGDRAETPLLDLVRAGIENDFERVVFPEYPELREVKRVLQREGARYASLSGSGSTLYGVFASGEEAQAAAQRMRAAGHAAVATTTLTRDEYWRRMFV